MLIFVQVLANLELGEENAMRRKTRRFVSSTREERRRKRTTTIALWAVILFAFFVAGYIAFRHYHFAKNTFIEGTDCTWLTVDEAKNKIEERISEDTIKFVFHNGNSKIILGKKVGIHLKDAEELSNILNEQTLEFGLKRKDYELKSSVLVDKQKLAQYLSTITELQEQSAREAQNAYIKWSEIHKQFVIVPEVYGFNVSIDQACELAYETIEKGNMLVDFSTMATTPEITSDDLQENLDELNAILMTKITWQLPDDSTYTLDYNVMKDWIQQEDGSYSINLEEEVTNFVEVLSKEVSDASSSFRFSSSSLGEEIDIQVEEDLRAKLNQKEQVAQIMDCFAMTANYTCLPEYSTLPINQQLNSYVELDITAQKVWLYKNGVCILETPVVTGDVDGGHGTPTGIYYLTYKETDRVLRGYNDDGSKYASPVEYWMPFNGGIGFHDASWRYGKFGGDIYKTNGSHGCVNMPLDAAKTLYENIDSSMPIIVYKS